MKKLLSLFLCIVLMCTMLVSCAEEKIGDYLENYPELEGEVENLTLNLYIIVGEGTSDNAKTSVSRELNAHTLTQFNTTLKVHYVPEADYATTVSAAIEAGGENAPHIVLVNSYDMMTSLKSKFADLTSYLDGKNYGKLNTQLPEALLSGSKIDGKLYSIPNNHLIGSYDYLVIHKETARYYNYSNEKLNSYNSLEDAQALIDEMRADGKNDNDIDSLVYTVSGPYEKKAELEASGYVCNVISAPVVTPEIAFSSAFAVVNNASAKYNDRAMQLIYEINSNVYFRNLLQYGVKDTNYTIENGVVTRITTGENSYNMNLLYTGDVFKAYYCEELGWTEADHLNAKHQNDDAVLPTVTE